MIMPRNLDFEEPSIDFSETYTWRGMKFIPRPNEQHFRSKRQADTVVSWKVPVRNSYKRIDEPDTGTMVVVENVHILDNYLMGTARRPFRTPRKYFIIVLRKAETGWRDLAGAVMEKLWKDYGIINALIMAPCADTGEDVRSEL